MWQTPKITAFLVFINETCEFWTSSKSYLTFQAMLHRKHITSDLKTAVFRETIGRGSEPARSKEKYRYYLFGMAHNISREKAGVWRWISESLLYVKPNK